MLLLTTFMWGGCVSCDQYFMWPGAKACCAPGGRCKDQTKDKGPAQKNSGRECNQIAFDHQKSFDLHIDLPVAATIAFVRPMYTAEPLADWRGATPVEPSPPDLLIVNSIFRI